MDPMEKVAAYEALVEQLMRDSPDEKIVAELMKALDIENPDESTGRLAKVLENINFALAEGFLRKESNDISKHS